MIRSSKRLAIGAATILCAATLTACGSGAADEEKKITVGNYPNSVLSLPVAVATGEDFFADEDIEVELIDMKTGPELVSTLIGGTTQIAAASTGTGIPPISEGQDLKVLPPFSKENKVLMAGGDTGITKPEHLKGSTIAVPVRGGDAELFAVEVLADYGVKADDVTFLATGAPATLAAAVMNGKADAAAVTLSTVELIRSKGGEVNVVVSPHDGTAGKRGEIGVSGFQVTTGDYWKENPENVKAYCRGLLSASEFIADPANEAAVVKYIEDWVGLPAEGAKKVYEAEHEGWFAELSEKQWSDNTKMLLDGDTLPYDHVVNDCE